MKTQLKMFILFLIQIIEKYEYRNKELNEDDISKKIIDTLDIKNLKIETDTGYSPISKIHLTQPYKIFNITTSTNKKLSGADNHIVFNEFFEEVFIKDLKVGSEIQTKTGVDKVKSITTQSQSISMFDVSVDDDNHRFYSNDILSHNTITSSIFLAWYACFHSDRNVLVIANKMATTIEIVDKIKTVIKKLPFFLKPGTISAGATGIKFDNNVRIFSQATTKTAAIGFTIHLLYADEFAHIPNNFITDFWRSIYPTLTSSKVAKVIISSTPNGMNLFWKIYDNALRNENQFKAIRVDWWQVPERDEQWKKDEIANLGSEELFNQEYGNQFLSSSKMLFSSRILNYVERTSHEFMFKEIYDLEYFEEDITGLKWHKDFDPNRVNPKDKFVFSIDIGDGVGRDYSIINIFKIDTNSKAMIKRMKTYDNEVDFFRLIQIGLFRSNILSVEQFAKIAEELIFNIFNYEKVRIVLEINFKGNLFFDRLSRNVDFYPEIFLHSQHNQTSVIYKPGVKIKKDNREIYIRELRNFISNKRIVIQNLKTFTELASFGLNKNGKYEAQTGNDDIAMSIVLLIPYFTNLSFYEDVEEIMEHKSDDILGMIHSKMNDLPEDYLAGKNSVTWMKYLNENWGSNTKENYLDPKIKGKTNLKNVLEGF